MRRLFCIAALMSAGMTTLAQENKVVIGLIGDSTVADTYGWGPSFAAKVTDQVKVPFIDLYSISIEHHNRIGPEASSSYNFESGDTTHFSKEGANAIAELIGNELKTVVPDLARFIKQGAN